jgi:hypothetical protein
LVYFDKSPLSADSIAGNRSHNENHQADDLFVCSFRDQDRAIWPVDNPIEPRRLAPRWLLKDLRQRKSMMFVKRFKERYERFDVRVDCRSNKGWFGHRLELRMEPPMSDAR